MRVIDGFPVITLLVFFFKKKRSPLPKNGLERRVWQFYTICDENQLLKVKVEKVMAVLVLEVKVPRWLDFSYQAWLQMCLKFVWQKSQFVWGARAYSTMT